MTSSGLCLSSSPPCVLYSSSSSSIVFHGSSRRLRTSSNSNSNSSLQSLRKKTDVRRFVRNSHGRLTTTSENSQKLAAVKKKKESSDADGSSAAAVAADHHNHHHHHDQGLVSSSNEEQLLSEAKSSKPLRFVSKDFTPTNESRKKKKKKNVHMQAAADRHHHHHHRAPALFATTSANAVIAVDSGEFSSSPRQRLSRFQTLDWRGKAYVLLVLGSGIVGVIWASKKLFTGVHDKVSGGGGGGGEDGGSPLSIVAKGFSTVQENLGPWSFQDLTLGLAAISKVTEKDPPKPPGRLAKDELSNDAHFLALAQHWRAMAEAVYVFDPASFSLQSHLPESAIVAAEWTPNQETLRPAYVVCIDAPYGAVVLSVRGTSQVVDMLVNSGASAEPFMGGQGHGGFVHATEKLIKEAVPAIEKAFTAHGKVQKNLKLVIVGHSMGAAVGIMAGMKLKNVFPNLECWGYSTPACVTLNLASSCESYVTSFLANHDIVPRFSIAAVEQLRQRIFDFNWEEGDRIARGDEDWEKIKSGADSLRQVQQKQNDISTSVQQAQEGISEKVQDVNKKMGSPTSGSQEDREMGDSEKGEKEEKRREHPPMYPPGRLLVLASEPPGCGKSPEQRSNVPQQRNMGTYPTFDEARNVKWAMYEAKPEEIGELVVSPWCVSDHMLGNLGEGIAYLQCQCEPAFGGMPK